MNWQVSSWQKVTASNNSWVWNIHFVRFLLLWYIVRCKFKPRSWNAKFSKLRNKIVLAENSYEIYPTFKHLTRSWHRSLREREKHLEKCANSRFVATGISEWYFSSRVPLSTEDARDATSSCEFSNEEIALPATTLFREERGNRGGRSGLPFASKLVSRWTSGRGRRKKEDRSTSDLTSCAADTCHERLLRRLWRRKGIGADGSDQSKKRTSRRAEKRPAIDITNVTGAPSTLLRHWTIRRKEKRTRAPVRLVVRIAAAR